VTLYSTSSSSLFFFSFSFFEITSLSQKVTYGSFVFSFLFFSFFLMLFLIWTKEIEKVIIVAGTEEQFIMLFSSSASFLVDRLSLQLKRFFIFNYFFRFEVR